MSIEVLTDTQLINLIERHKLELNGDSKDGVPIYRVWNGSSHIPVSAPTLREALRLAAVALIAEKIYPSIALRSKFDV